jgi:hypothetical protein
LSQALDRTAASANRSRTAKRWLSAKAPMKRLDGEKLRWVCRYQLARVRMRTRWNVSNTCSSKWPQFELSLSRLFDAGALVAIVGLRGSPMTGLPLSTAITREDFAFVSTLRVPRFPIAETATMNQSRHDQDDKSRLLQGLPSLAAQGAEARPARGKVMETASCRARARRGAFGRLAMGL